MGPPGSQKLEMRICRLCGVSKKENIDIFNSKTISPKSEDLLTKILTVYPMVLYKNDPLPQFICPRCIGNVSTTYQHIQQVLRQQTKWMNLTRAVEPEHVYFHILSAVEDSTDSTIEFIKTAYDIDISNAAVRKMMTNPQIENPLTNTIEPTYKLDINETVVKNIKNKLESNGFTIKRIKVTPTNNIAPNFNTKCNLLNSTNDDNNVTCNYCQKKFSNLKILAQHQLIHLKVNANKVFQRRFLPKESRRGRLITINDTKCLRCLNCWRIFNDNKSILQHWSDGECEYYCSICGKEFPHSLKMLRDHVVDEHEVNYRSITELFMKNKDKLLITKPTNTKIPTVSTKIKTGYKKSPPKSCTKNDDGTITCKICYKVFDNFRSSNSHMRKHKPPTTRFGDPNAASLNNYLTQDDYNTQQPTTSNSQYSYNNNPMLTSLIMKPIRPTYRAAMNNSGTLHGMKTKNMQNRPDFLNNYPTNIRQSYHSPVTSVTPDINDDEDVIVPEVIMPVIKSEPLFDDNDDGGFEGLPIKSEPIDNFEDGLEAEEPRLCFICNESFSNSNDYELHTKFVHNIN